MYKYFAAITCLLMATINIPFIIQDKKSFMNWASMIFCASLGILSIIFL